MTVPAYPKIYHITHLDNLLQLSQSEWLWSDAERIKRGLDCRIVGMSKIKLRRLNELHVHCHMPTKVGEYTPFNFCPRSVMLFILHRANDPDLQYREGQRPIVHLEADLRQTVDWATNCSLPWAFSFGNAGSRYTSFYREWSDLAKLNWDAIESTDFRDADVKEAKQAEFLVHQGFPWQLVERIGVVDELMAEKVRATIANCNHQPVVSVERRWYY